jgi:hypothetical protein
VIITLFSSFATVATVLPAPFDFPHAAKTNTPTAAKSHAKNFFILHSFPDLRRAIKKLPSSKRKKTTQNHHGKTWLSAPSFASPQKGGIDAKKPVAFLSAGLPAYNALYAFIAYLPPSFSSYDNEKGQSVPTVTGVAEQYSFPY